MNLDALNSGMSASELEYIYTDRTRKRTSNILFTNSSSSPIFLNGRSEPALSGASPPMSSHSVDSESDVYVELLDKVVCVELPDEESER